MCSKNNSPSDIQKMKKKKKKAPKQRRTTKQHSASSSSSSSSSSSLKPLKRRNRTKTRKPKYLSLRLQLSKNQQPKKTTIQQEKQEAQLNLLPQNPVVESDKDMMHEENNVALLFTSDGGATLTGLLEEESTTTTAGTGSAEEEGSYSALTCDRWLVRKAMRKSSREEEGSEERWVCYSEVVEKTEEVTSTDPLFWGGGGVTTSFGLLSLKLDHEGILNAWSDKGSLYVAAEDHAPQLVPDAAFLHPPYVPWGSDAVGNTWKVPEDCGVGNNKMTVKDEMGLKLGQREASVLRYKEKRQSRLFAKRIRYEVRKLNAEKRPRMKGRFVKRE